MRIKGDILVRSEPINSFGIEEGTEASQSETEVTQKEWGLALLDARLHGTHTWSYVHLLEA